MLSIYSIGHGPFAGVLSFRFDMTKADELRTNEDIVKVLEKLDKAMDLYPYIQLAYLTCFEDPKPLKAAKISSLMFALKSRNLALIGVTSPALSPEWIKNVNHFVVSGAFDEYEISFNLSANEHLVDESPLDGLAKIPEDKNRRKLILYNSDKINSFPEALKRLSSAPNQTYGFYTYKTYKVELK